MRPGSAVALIAALLSGCAVAQEPAIAPAPAARPDIVALIASPAVGGVSGIEVTENGRGFVAVTDRAVLLTGVLEHDGDRLTAARVTDRRALPHPPRVEIIDSEGLALAPDGTLHVSLEYNRGVWSIAPDDTVTVLPAPPRMRASHINAQFEALANDEKGRLVTLPERSGEEDRPFPLWRLEDGAWSLLREIPRRDGWLPTGADFGPDGSFYLLERRSRLGVVARVRRFDLSRPDDPGELLWRSPGPGADNYEGLSVFRAPSGRIHLLMVSDNNQIPFLPTRILSLALAPEE